MVFHSEDNQPNKRFLLWPFFRQKREEQNVILSRSSPRAWLTLRPNNLDITVSFGNIPIILIIPFINAFVLLGMMSKPREKKSCTWNTRAKKKKRNNDDRNDN